MDRFDKELLDSLKYRVEKAEEELKNATPDRVNRCLTAFLDAKEDYIALKNKFGL